MGRRPQDRILAALGGYYVATAAVPFVSRRAFEAVTGPKTEWWLVQTVGVLVGVVGGSILSAVARDRVTPEIAGLAAGCASGLAAIEVVHVTRRRIAPIYLADAAVELAAVAGLAATSRRRSGPAPASH